MPTQRITRIYNGPDGESHFEDVELHLRDFGAIGAVREGMGRTTRIPGASGMVVLTNSAPLRRSSPSQGGRKRPMVLLQGGVFSKDLIESWISYKLENDIDPMRMRPHEFELYFDC